jgi:Fic family protein
MRKTGMYEKLGSIDFFTPFSLPPDNPPLTMTPEIIELCVQAMYNLGTLNATSKRLPDQKRFIKTYAIKEALLSSAIEGIHTTLIEVFTYSDNLSTEINKNTQLVVNYMQALEIAINMIEQQNLPICSRVILAAHKALLSNKDGQNSDPGNYRNQTVRVGSLVPPMAPKIPDLMADLERYINENKSLPVIIQAGLVHLQFETIHPFLDGNGRIGRLLIILMLLDSKLLDDPILYISYYFKKHHAQYYQALDKVRTHGDFEGWIVYYLQAVTQSAFDANLRIQEIQKLELVLKNQITNNPEFLKTKDLAYEILQHLFATPVITIAQMSHKINKTYNTTSVIMNKFIEMKIIVQTDATEHKRYKQYCFMQYLDLLEKEL